MADGSGRFRVPGSSACAIVFKAALRLGLLLIALVNTQVASASSSGVMQPVWAPEPAAMRPLDNSGLEAFVDGFVAAENEIAPIAGAMVSVVQGSEVLLSKGYGDADIAGQLPVSPQDTLFRLGSTSKLFTWIAVMQLVEAGELDLHVDVNSYLKRFQIPPTFTEPVTLWHLMTHTAGFEDGWAGFLIVRDPGRVLPLAEALEKHRPTRVRPVASPDDVLASSYSNWGAALAGLVVANVSGMSFPDYVRVNIFEPLGMRSSTFEEPLPPPLAKRLSKGYMRAGTHLTEGWMEYLGNYAPAGAISASLHDMTRFLLMLANDGELDGARILEPDTLREMLTVAYRPGTYVPGTGLGFEEYRLNGWTFWAHGGDTPFFHTELLVQVETRVGIFFSVNTAQAGMAPRNFIQVLADRYFPATLPRLSAIPESADRIERFAGSYRSTRHAHTKNEKLLVLPKELVVMAPGDGTLVVDDFGEQRTFIPVADAVFREADSATVIEFVEDSSAQGVVGLGSHRRLQWYETRGFHQTLMAVVMLVFALAMVRTGILWKRDSTLSLMPRLALRGSGVLAAVGLVDLLLLGSIFTHSPIQLANAIPSSFRVGVALTTVWVPLLCVVSATLLWLILRPGVYLGTRLYGGLFIVASVGLLWALDYWNLIGFHFA